VVKFSGLFGVRGPGAVTLVETPVSRWYARQARAAFLVVLLAGSVFGFAVLSLWFTPVRAGLFGVGVGAVAGVVAGVVVRVWPVLRVVWHWGTELVVTGVVVAGFVWVARVVHPVAAAGVLVVVVGVVVGVGPVRRRVVPVVWCVVVRHRLRVVFADVIRSSGRSRPAGLPLILWVRPTPAGERAWLWLRPGTELADLTDRVSRIAVTCWAKHARVVACSPRRAALVRVDLTRRDPLAGVVVSPLLRLVPDWAAAKGPVSTGSAPVGLDLGDVPEAVSEPVSVRRVRGGRVAYQPSGPDGFL